MTNGRILVHGHRGARAVLPENTIPAFEYAIGLGVDVLELDMAVTKDGALVVSHDPWLEPPICAGPLPKARIHDLTLDEVQQWDCGAQQNPRFPKQQTIAGTRMPTLDEVFSLAARGSFHFNIETKIFKDEPELSPGPEEFAELVLAMVRRHKLEDRVILQSFDFRTLHAMERLEPAIRRSALYEGKARDFVEIAREAHATIVSPEQVLVTRDQVAACRAAGVEVVPWTANTAEEFAPLVAAGVDAIISDDPAELLRYLGRVE